MSRVLNVGFAGTPEFAKVALECLIQSGYPVKLVFTQPDRPAGRGMKLMPSPVKQAALNHHIPVFQPQSFRAGDEGGLESLQALRSAVDGQRLDLLIVAAYGLILPQVVLDAPRLGCLNIHASLLPRWRGAAPIQRAIEAGDTQTGVCIMQMEAGLDTGPVRLTRQIPIESTDTASTLHDKLAIIGASALIEALDALVVGRLPLIVQPEAGVTYAAKISKTEGKINWSRSALELQRILRAFDPFPGCYTEVNQLAVKCFDPVLQSMDEIRSTPGMVLEVGKAGVLVQCGQGSLWITAMQKPGAKRGSALMAAQSLHITPGTQLM